MIYYINMYTQKNKIFDKEMMTVPIKIKIISKITTANQLNLVLCQVQLVEA